MDLEEQIQESDGTGATLVTRPLDNPGETERRDGGHEASSFTQPRRVDTEQRIGGLDQATSPETQPSKMEDERQVSQGSARTTAISPIEGSKPIERRPTSDSDTFIGPHMVHAVLLSRR